MLAKGLITFLLANGKYSIFFFQLIGIKLCPHLGCISNSHPGNLDFCTWDGCIQVIHANVKPDAVGANNCN